MTYGRGWLAAAGGGHNDLRLQRSSRFAVNKFAFQLILTLLYWPKLSIIKLFWKQLNHGSIEIANKRYMVNTETSMCIEKFKKYFIQLRTRKHTRSKASSLIIKSRRASRTIFWANRNSTTEFFLNMYVYFQPGKCAG